MLSFFSFSFLALYSSPMLGVLEQSSDAQRRAASRAERLLKGGPCHEVLSVLAHEREARLISHLQA
jgi:hypothetical protein